jgi:hypothetical protein
VLLEEGNIQRISTFHYNFCNTFTSGNIRDVVLLVDGVVFVISLYDATRSAAIKSSRRGTWRPSIQILICMRLYMGTAY